MKWLIWMSKCVSLQKINAPLSSTKVICLFDNSFHSPQQILKVVWANQQTLVALEKYLNANERWSEKTMKANNRVWFSRSCWQSLYSFEVLFAITHEVNDITNEEQWNYWPLMFVPFLLSIMVFFYLIVSFLLHFMVIRTVRLSIRKYFSL